MSRFFGTVNRGDLIFVWEPRGEWSDDIILRLCHDLNLVHCANPLERAMLYGNPQYFRLHGGHNYRHQYADDELARLQELSVSGAYVLFNNLTMYEDASRFKELIEGGRILKKICP